MAVELRQQLLDVAAAILDADGIDAVTIRETARRCGVSHGAPRRHFPTRANLLGHVAKGITGDLMGDVIAAGNEPIGTARAYVAFAAQRPHAFDLLVRHDLLEASGADLRSTTLPLVGHWRDIWCRKHPSADDTEALARLVAVHGIASLVSHQAHEVMGLDADAVLEVVLRAPDCSAPFDRLRER